MFSSIDITTYNNVTSLIIAAMNGGLFIFYILLLFVYFKEYTSKNIIIFLSIELTISSALYGCFFIYFYIRTYHVILCVINAIVQIIVIAALNGIPFVFYLLLFFLYIKQYKHQNIISFLSSQLTLSSSLLSFFYIYYYFKSVFPAFCVFNAIYQPAVTMTTIALSGYIPFITMRILTHQEKIREKFKKYSLLSILLCWVVSLILSIAMYIIDIRLKTFDSNFNLILLK